MTAASSAACIWLVERTSAATNWAKSPELLGDCAAVGLRQVNDHDVGALPASASAVARPSPEAPPVTRVELSATSTRASSAVSLCHMTINEYD